MWDLERLRFATEAAEVGLWSWNVDTDEISLNERSHALWETSADGLITFRELSERVHPEDIDRVGKSFEATRTMAGLYEIDFRIMLASKQIRWVSARGHGNGETMVGRTTFGIFLDITERKEADEARELHSGEMSHRIKNLFSIASALTLIASRSAATTTEMAGDLSRRLHALSRAHDLVRPVPGDDKNAKAVLLSDLLAVLLVSYDEEGAVGSRVYISVPEVRVGERSATTVALVVHELATNSVKYGALAAAGGRLGVTCAEDDGELIIVWTETGGLPVSAPANPDGFGAKLVRRTVSGQLGGSITYDWPPSGAIITIRLNKTLLAR
jgi:two-component sensor histidine kinase